MLRLRSCGARALVDALLVVFVLSLGACGGSSSTSSLPPSEVGRLAAKPGGGLYFVDAHQHGQARALRLSETAWARLVDVYDVDASGARGVQPVFSDLPVTPEVHSDADFVLEADALGRAKLVIRHPRATPDFELALRRAAQNLSPIASKDDDGSSAPPFTMVARDAALVLRFDDLLQDSDDVRDGLAQSTRVLVGYPPLAREAVRVFFDESHGDLAPDGFHPTRVVVDFTISALELPAPDPLPVNPIGLPASLLTSRQPNVSVRVATREDFGTGVFSILRNLRGRALVSADNGPQDEDSSTLDVVRALRSGNLDDPFHGFLPDFVPPALVGRWRATVNTAVRDPLERGAFVLSLAFGTACAKALAPGELIETTAGFLEITQPSAPPDPASGAIAEVHARAGGASEPSTGELLGLAHVWTTFAGDPGIAPECFVEVLDGLPLDPGTRVPTAAHFRVRFSEPMDPQSFDPLESVRLFSGREADATHTVISTISTSLEANAFDLEPLLPLGHEQGEAESYTLEFVATHSVTDLAGNAPSRALPAMQFEVQPDQPSLASSGLSLRFDSPDEYDLGVEVGGLSALGITPSAEPPVKSERLTSDGPDLRGTFRYDPVRGVLLPRAVVHQSWTIDKSLGLPSLMLPLPVGVREPFGRMGSRLQTLWRYADAGWKVTDETHYDLDVEGLSWAPFGGHVLSDFLPGFEVRLGHSTRLPDEANILGALLFPFSGLLDAPFKFVDNVLEPDGARPISQRALGYQINPAARFQSTTGTTLLHFPVDHGGARVPFVWRDTSLQGVGGAQSAGVPQAIERVLDPRSVTGSVAPPGNVPTFGLPLLIELFAFSSDSILGVNDFQVAIAVNGQLQPNFRVHSTGGRDVTNREIRIDPDLTPVPTGGFSTTSVPNGLPTRSADPTLYYGQLDTVSRVGRVHTVWFDTQCASPDYFRAKFLPAPTEQPAGTSVVLDFRGALRFAGTDGAELDATQLDAYGEVKKGSVVYPRGRGWTRDIDQVDGLRYLQIRITFTSNLESGVSPELDSLGVAFVRH